MSASRHLEAQEAEFSVLGGILLDNSALDRIGSTVRSDDFYDPRHRLIFERMLELSDQRQPIDPVTLATSLEKAGLLEEVGGLEYVLGLAEAVATAVNLEHHARIVHERAEVRRLISACTQIIEKARSGEYDDTEQLVDEAQQAVFEIGQRQQSGALVGLNEALKEVITSVRRAYETKAVVTGTPTGFVDLDNMTSGLQPGDLVILAARPSMGKTAFALNLVSNAAKQAQKTVAVFSLEMPTAQIVQRLLALEARVDQKGLRTGHLADGDIDRIMEAVRRMASWPVYVDDTPGITVMDARSRCRRLAGDRSLPDLGLVVIDYLQLMRGRANSRSREQEISEISRNLKAMAKELNAPVIALSQLNRSCESRPNKRPLMSDLRESGAIEQDADVIMFIYRDEVYNENTEDKGIAEIIIGKQRNGPIGTCRLKFFRQWTRFDNLMADE